MGYAVRSHSECREAARFLARLLLVVGAVVAVWIISPSTADADEPTDTIAETTSAVEPTETVADATSAVAPTETVADATSSVAPTETVAETTSSVAPTETVAETTSPAVGSTSSTVSDATESAPETAQAAA